MRGRKEVFVFEQDYLLKSKLKSFQMGIRKALLGKLFNILEYQSYNLEEM